MFFKMMQLDENDDQTGWQRVYYESTSMGTNHFRGVAQLDDLRQKLQTSNCKTLIIEFRDIDGGQEIYLSSQLNVMIDGKYLSSGTFRKLQHGIHELQIDFLRFKIEVR